VQINISKREWDEIMKGQTPMDCTNCWTMHVRVRVHTHERHDLGIPGLNILWSTRMSGGYETWIFELG
jgi:hypothetical protein